jgi:hypothetical protein
LTHHISIPIIYSYNKRNSMKKNMGSADRIIRVAVAIVLGIMIVSGVVGGTLATILGVVAVVFLLTSVVSFCPAYVPFKISTCKTSDRVSK